MPVHYVEQLLARYVAAYATHIQRDELDNTKSDERRTALDKVFVGLSSELEVPTETAVFGVSRWGSSKWSSEPNLCTRIKSDLDELNGKKRNNVQDALIAETSIKCGLILVTDDQDMTVVTKKYGGKCLSFEGMLKEVIE